MEERRRYVVSSTGAACRMYVLREVDIIDVLSGLESGIRGVATG